MFCTQGFDMFCIQLNSQIEQGVVCLVGFNIWKNSWGCLWWLGLTFIGWGSKPEETMHKIYDLYVKMCILDLMQFESTYFLSLALCPSLNFKTLFLVLEVEMTFKTLLDESNIHFFVKIHQ